MLCVKDINRQSYCASKYKYCALNFLRTLSYDKKTHTQPFVYIKSIYMYMSTYIKSKEKNY